jgi:hypothetical protein
MSAAATVLRCAPHWSREEITFAGNSLDEIPLLRIYLDPAAQSAYMDVDGT